MERNDDIHFSGAFYILYVLLTGTYTALTYVSGFDISTTLCSSPERNGYYYSVKCLYNKLCCN